MKRGKKAVNFLLLFLTFLVFCYLDFYTKLAFSIVFPYKMSISKEQRNQLKLLLRQICLAVRLSTPVRPQEGKQL